MEELSSTVFEGRRYRYIHDVTMGPPEVIDIHHVILKNNARKGHIFCIFTAVLLVPASFLKFSVQGNSVAIALLWDLLIIGGCLIGTIMGKQVNKGVSDLILAALVLCVLSLLVAQISYLI